MKILGVGVDIIENRRIGKLIKKKIFIKRIFSENEISFSKKTTNKTNFFSKRFQYMFTVNLIHDYESIFCFII